MKIKAHVLTVDDYGDRIKLLLQGSAVGEAEWRAMLKFEVFVPDNNRNRRAFYLGRKVNLEITPS